MSDSSGAPHALEMRGISISFGPVQVLREVDFLVPRGHVHALLGENGAGKSTLMKILDGVYPAGRFRGDIHLQGKPVQFHSPHDAWSQGIGYVPQEISVLENLTVAENILVGHWNGRSPWVTPGQLQARAARILEETRIPLDPSWLVATYNASQRQLVMIARALSQEPSVLILDEATACLTHEEAEILFRVVRHLRDRGITTIFITHKLAEVYALADSATVMRDGAVVARLRREELKEETIVPAMIGRKLDQFYPHRTPAEHKVETLRVENLTVPHPHLANRNVVQDVSFELKRGEILGLAGLVGAGRSEVVNALYGRTEFQGKVFFEGHPVDVHSPREAMRLGLGLVTEERKKDGLLLEKSVKENITLHNLRRVSRGPWLSSTKENAVAEEYKTRLAIRAPSIHAPVHQLSGGNQQKVILSKILLAEPQVIFLDEPTKGIDVGAKSEIYRLIFDLAREGVSFVLISSELPELLALCDRFVVLARGRVTGRLERSEANEESIMAAATG